MPKPLVETEGEITGTVFDFDLADVLRKYSKWHLTSIMPISWYFAKEFGVGCQYAIRLSQKYPWR